VSLVSDQRHRKGGVGMDGDFYLPSFNVPKGIEPLLTLYQHALLNGACTSLNPPCFFTVSFPSVWTLNVPSRIHAPLPPRLFCSGEVPFIPPLIRECFLFIFCRMIDPFLHFTTLGSAAQREVAASGIGDLVNWTSAEQLKPFLIKMTGPLIRVVGDKWEGPVKAAILQTLRLLLDKGGKAQKPFVPQLQKAFLKALSDSSNAVRVQAIAAIGQLMDLRCDKHRIEMKSEVRANWN